MSVTRTLLWLALLASVAFFQFRGWQFRQAEVCGIFSFETATQAEANEIVTEWKNAKLLTTAKRIIQFDFFFIAIYFALMVGCFNDRMTLEKNRFLNTMLQSSIPLALVIALLDVTENLIFLWNLKSLPDQFIRFWLGSWIKFILAGLVVVFWVASLLKEKWFDGSPKNQTA